MRPDADDTINAETAWPALDDTDRSNEAYTEEELWWIQNGPMPEDIRAMLQDPERPRATEWRHARPIADHIWKSSNIGREVEPVLVAVRTLSRRAEERFDNAYGTYLFPGRKWTREAEEWYQTLDASDRELVDSLRKASAEADEVKKSGVLYIYKALTDMFYHEVDRAKSPRGKRVIKRATNRDLVLDALKLDGDGPGLSRKDLEKATKRSDKWVRDRLTELEDGATRDENGRLESRYIVSERGLGIGASAPFVYWRRATPEEDA